MKSFSGHPALKDSFPRGPNLITPWPKCGPWARVWLLCFGARMNTNVIAITSIQQSFLQLSVIFFKVIIYTDSVSTDKWCLYVSFPCLPRPVSWSLLWQPSGAKEADWLCQGFASFHRVTATLYQHLLIKKKRKRKLLKAHAIHASGSLRKEAHLRDSTVCVCRHNCACACACHRMIKALRCSQIIINIFAPTSARGGEGTSVSAYQRRNEKMF